MENKINKFIIEANKIHNNIYDYSLVNFNNKKTKAKIICQTHGIFEQRIKNHLKGSGCFECFGTKKKTTNEFIIEANIKHQNKYDYSVSEYKNARSKIKIICSNHGIFEQKASSHISGRGCPKCCGRNKTTEDFIINSNKIHNNIYDYSLVKYEKGNIKIKIICLKHGIFSQVPCYHLTGSGCPKCNLSKGELKIEEFLNFNNINYIKQFKFLKCKLKRNLLFDFYLPDYNTCVEYDGEYHYKIVKNRGGEEKFNLNKIRDNIKNEFCLNNNIKLIRIPYMEYKNIDTILNNII